MTESEFYLEVIEEVFDLLEVAEKGDPGADGTGGDMTKAVYDPTTVEGDAFSMGSMSETATAKVLTGIERTGPTQAEAENGVSTVTKLWSSFRVRQAIVSWAATAASIFSGIVSGYKEASETIAITAGAGSFDHSISKNIIEFDMVEATTITLSNYTVGKPVSLRFSNSVPDVLTITDGTVTKVSGTDFTLNGTAGKTEWLALDMFGPEFDIIGQGVVKGAGV